MRFKKRPQLPGGGRTRVWHHHGSDTPTSARAILYHTDQKGPNILKGSVIPWMVHEKDVWNFLDLEVKIDDDSIFDRA